MSVKGVVVVSEGYSPAVPWECAASQRIANRPIVCHAVDALVTAGIEDVAIVAPPAVVVQVRKCIDSDNRTRPRVTYLLQRERAGLLGALQSAAAFVGDDPCVAHFADGLLGQPIEQFTELMTPTGPDLLLLLHHSFDDRDRLTPATQKLLGVAELEGGASHLALAGVCVFGPGVMCRARAAAEACGRDADLIAVAERMAQDGCVLEPAFARAWRRYDGDPLDLLELNRIVLDQQIPQDQLLDRGDNRIEGRVIIHPTAEVTASTIFGPSIIGPRARVTNSYIGPYTSVGADVTIEGAEVVRSIVADGAQIMHVGGRIEGSTIGPRASIFRDFRLPRAMRLHVGPGVEVALN